MGAININDTLDALKRRLSNKDTMLVQGSKGTVFEGRFAFNPPAQENSLTEFEAETGWVLPGDYRQFLLRHNGANLFEDEYGSGFFLHGLSEISLNHQEYMPDHLYPAARYIDGAHLLIDSDLVKKGNPNYLVWFESLDFRPLRMDFGVWLERLVIAQGYPFWNWKF